MRSSPCITRRHALARLAGGLAAPIVSMGRAQAQSQAPFEGRLKSAVGEIAKALEKHNVAGASLVIVKDGEIVFLGHHGKRDLATGLPATVDTLFPVASMTKTFTALAAAIAVDEGRLTWGTHPRPLVPSFKLRDPAADQKVTISELLSHTTGLVRSDLFWLLGGLELPDLLRVAGEAEAVSDFGKVHNYNNQIFAAAGAMVAAAYGTTWAEHVRRRILEPLGMRATRPSVVGLEQAGDHAKGYQHDPAGGHSRLVCNPMDIVAPAGAMCSTARDLGSYLVMLSEGGVIGGRRIVSEAGLAAIWSPKVAVAQNVNYALGWYTIDVGGVRMVEHGGNAWGYTAELAVFPGRRLGMALLTNADGSPAGTEAADIVFRTLAAAPQSQPAHLPAALARAPERRGGRAEAALATHASALPDLVGHYRDGLDEAEVRQEGDHYVLRLPVDGTFRLAIAEDGRFRLEGRGEGHFVRADMGAGGAVQGLVLVEPGGERTLARIADALDGAEIVRRMIEAVGGADELNTIRSLVMRGRLLRPNEGTSSRFTRLIAAPYLFAEIEEIEALGRSVGTQRTYFDGDHFGIEVGNGHRPSGPTVVGAMRILRHISRAVTLRTDTTEVALGGRTQFSGRDAHTLRAVSRHGEIERLIVDAETFLPIRQDDVTVTAGGERVLQRTLFSNWQIVRGLALRMPYREVRHHADGQREVLDLDEIRVDEAIPPNSFQSRLPRP